METIIRIHMKINLYMILRFYRTKLRKLAGTA